ncbi:unnamed protein product [Coffea canephora]|uniref:DH200=94 genomic scaffold, scaffold_195 n=1 Tax=Coffea canephora TaxID=49390 RepID=A0A068VE70_COFCA|nr:unnamed protein product [Coffea canephora]
MKHIHYEDENSRYITIGCVEKVLCMLACWVEDPNGDYFKKHLARIPDYMWVAQDGMNMQVTDNPSGNFRRMYRHISKGAWTFSDQDHGWQVSDCTAEALKCCLLFSTLPPEIVGEKLEPERLYDAVNILLSLQSKNGGLPAWEPVGADNWLQLLNPTEILANCAVEHEYAVCTSSAINALVMFQQLFPGHREKERESFIVSASKYLENVQMPDGSWFGDWGVCFTYGTWFALGGLVAAGKTYDTFMTLITENSYLASLLTIFSLCQKKKKEIHSSRRRTIKSGSRSLGIDGAYLRRTSG